MALAGEFPTKVAALSRVEQSSLLLQRTDVDIPLKLTDEEKQTEINQHFLLTAGQ